MRLTAGSPPAQGSPASSVRDGRRRHGAIADNLIAAADEKRSERGPDAAVILIVGRSEHGYHHDLGSVSSALERHVHYPVIIIP